MVVLSDMYDSFPFPLPVKSWTWLVVSKPTFGKVPSSPISSTSASHLCRRGRREAKTPE